MAKFHIKNDGTPGACNAQKGNCPYGDAQHHFPSQEEAQEYADRVNMDKMELEKEESLLDIELGCKDLREINLSSKNIDEVDFYGANLEEADLSGATISLVDFEEANLKNANLRQIEGYSLVFKGTNLSGLMYLMLV